MEKMKLLKPEEIVVEKELYPRSSSYFGNVLRYADAMKAGDKFPPILVGFLDGKYYLIDGFHRLGAYKQNKEELVSVEVKYNMTKDEMYVEAVKLNSAHGHNLSSFDRATAIKRLTDMGYSKEVIQSIVRIPQDKIERFVSNRVTRSISGEEIILKNPLKHLAGQTGVVNDQEEMRHLSMRSQVQVLEQFIKLLENDWFDLKSKTVIKLLEDVEIKVGKLRVPVAKEEADAVAQ